MLNANESNICNNTDFCRNFPQQPSKSISRINLVEHAWENTRAGCRIIFIEGGPLSGKTVFLSEYMLEHPQDTIGIFLSAGDHYFYTTEYVKLAIYEQMHWIVYSAQSNGDYISDAEFSRLFLQLQKRAKKKPVTFLLDGLNETSGQELRSTKEILAMLPFSQNEFRFIISGSSEFLSTLGMERHNPKHAPLLPVSKDEARIYFDDCQEVSPQDVERIRHFCRGVIGQLSRFRELIFSGVPVADLLNEKDGTLRKLLDFEWSLLAQRPDVTDVLGYIAFSTQPLDLKKISSLTNRDVTTVNDLVMECRFLELDTSSLIVSMRSDEERRFVREQLKPVKSKFLEHFVSELLKNPKSEDAVRNLPIQLLDVGRHGDLITRLDEEHFVRLLSTEKSLKSLKRHCEIGFTAAKLSRDEAAEIRFALINSVVTGLTFSVGTKNEIQARLKLGERESAIALALSAPTSEERLQLLATVAKVYHSSHLMVPQELTQQIKSLVEEIDIRSLGNLARDIACDLLVIDFSLAVEIFEKSLSDCAPRVASKIQDDTETSIAAGAESSSSSVSFGKVHERLSEHQKQRFADAVASLVERWTADALLTRFETTEEKHQLFIAKQWLKRRRKDPCAWKVAEHALTVTLRDLSRPPRLQDFREIAVVLPHIDVQHAEKLAKRIKAQVATQRSFGTNVESVRLQMALIRADHLREPAASDNELLELFSEIHEIKEISIRAACWAWMLYGIQKLSDPAAVDGRTTVVTEITTKLIESIEHLLNDSADHYETAKNALYGLARANPILAVKLVEKLNTRPRRDKAFVTLARELVVGKSYLSNPGLFLQCIKNIEGEAERENAVLTCLDLIADDSERGESVTENKGILNLWRGLRVAIRKFTGGVSAYRIVASSSVEKTFLETVSKELKDLWPSVMVDWIRTDAGYSLVRDLAKVNRELAVGWLESVKTEQQRSRIPSKSLAKVLYYTVKLAVISFIATAPKDIEPNDPQFSRIAFLIEEVPVPEFKITLWCDLATSLYFKGKRNSARMICTEYIQPVIQGDFENNLAVRDALISIAAPILYLNHSPSAHLLIEKISNPHTQEGSYADICETIFRKRSLNDPYKRHETPGFDLDSEDIASMLDLVDNLKTDSILFGIIGDICESLASKKNTNKIRRAQVRDVLISIDEIIDRKFPDQRNIKHDGYKLASKAFVLKARATFEAVPPDEWDRLYQSAHQIDNVADRVVVIAMIGVSAKGKGPFSEKKWLTLVKQDISKIPSDADRIDRYSWIAELLDATEKQFALGLLQDAMSLSNHLDDQISAFEKQKRILDLAHNIDESLVDKIIDLADTDEAKSTTKKDYEEHIKLKDGRKELAADPSGFDFNSVTPEELSSLCFDNWAALGGGRIFLKSVEDFSNLADVASRMSMSMAFPIWGWIIENALRKSAGKSKADRLLQDSYEASCRAAELILALLGQSKHELQLRKENSCDLIHPGERDEIFQRIRSWAASQDAKTIRISDPYFGPGDLEVIHTIAEAAPKSQIRVLTCKKHLKDVTGSSYDEAFHEAWRNLCDLPPPATEVVVVAWGQDASHPVHDRWIFTDSSGLRLGGSTNSMGYSRLSEISAMDSHACAEKCTVIDGLLDRKTKEWAGDRVITSSFDLY